MENKKLRKNERLDNKVTEITETTHVEENEILASKHNDNYKILYEESKN